MKKFLNKKTTVFLISLITFFIFSHASVFARNEVVFWDLNTQLFGQAEGVFFRGANNMWDAGMPNAIRVQTHNGLRGLHVPERTNYWQGIDIRVEAIGMQAGDRIEVSGRMCGTARAVIQLHRQGGRGGQAVSANTSAGDSFALSYTLTSADEGIHALRLSTVSRTNPFFVDRIEIFRDRALVEATGTWDLTLPSFSQMFARHFHIGNIWSHAGNMLNPEIDAMFLHHYNAATAENNHKVSLLLGNVPNAWEWNWGVSDAIMDWAEENEISVSGHTLVWHESSQAWLTNVPGTLEPLTRAEAIENLHRYIATVAGRYVGRMQSWDVINEIIEASPSSPISHWNRNPDWRAYLRNNSQGLNFQENTNHFSRWYDAFANGADASAGECGSDIVYYAFRFARIYDPFAVLYYNDFATYYPVKREVIAQMTEQINERWRTDPLYDGRLLIEGIGMQGHFPLNGPNSQSLRDTLKRYAATGARISITELDIPTYDYRNPPSAAQMPRLLTNQSQAFENVFAIFLEFSDNIERVAFWGKADHLSWRRGNALLFDGNLQAKPAFFAILGTAANERSNISVPVITTENLPAGETGEDFAFQLSATQNNFAPMRWRVISGELPNGLRLISTTGAIMGTPTQNGTYTFTVAAENALGSGNKTLTIIIGDGKGA